MQGDGRRGAGMVVLITGLMASGKSTVAQLLAEKLPKAVHVRGDVFRKMVVSGRADMSHAPTAEALAQLDLRYRLTAHTAKAYAAAGFDVIVQDNYYGDKLPYMLSLLAPEAVRAVVLCPSAQVIARREETRGKVGYTGFEIEALHSVFMAETPRIGVWLDTGEWTAEETAEWIFREVFLHDGA